MSRNSNRNAWAHVAKHGTKPKLTLRQKMERGRKNHSDLENSCVELAWMKYRVNLFKADAEPARLADGSFVTRCTSGMPDRIAVIFPTGRFVGFEFKTGAAKLRPNQQEMHTEIHKAGGLAYEMTKAMVELFPRYKGASPGIDGWSLERQNFAWAVPYHDGAIRYFKEIGRWTGGAQQNNDGLIARQRVLAAAWKQMLAKSVADEAAFAAEWSKLRAARLTAAGLDPVYT